MWDGWFLFPLRDFKDPQDDVRWHRAWHGSKLESVYSILHNSALIESGDESRGDRLLAGTRGVYVHKGATSHKAENYVRFAQLAQDGVFWASKWELRVDTTCSVNPGVKTDQSIFKAEGVRLAGL